MMDKPYIKISAQFIGKNIPKEQLGLTQTRVNFGTNGASLRQLINSFVVELCQLHQQILRMGDEDILSELSDAIDDLDELLIHVRKKITETEGER